MLLFDHNSTFFEKSCSQFSGILSSVSVCVRAQLTDHWWVWCSGEIGALAAAPQPLLLQGEHPSNSLQCCDARPLRLCAASPHIIPFSRPPRNRSVREGRAPCSREVKESAVCVLTEVSCGVIWFFLQWGAALKARVSVFGRRFFFRGLLFLSSGWTFESFCDRQGRG